MIEALISLGFLVLALYVGIMIFEVDPHVPMFIGVIGAALMALWLGYKWEEIEKSMMDGIYKALQSVCILIIVGVLIGVWINAGVVPAMVYYGLKILHPAIFFIATVLICSITSLATGTSWGTMGTMGVAFMGIGFGLNMSPAMTAGAILSGAYFGDKMSPLSDTTNLAPAMAGTDVMSHVKAMLVPTVITYGITLVVFGVLGATQYHGGDADMSRVVEFSNALNAANGGVFNINPLLLLPPVIVIVAVALKVPAIPGITLGILAGAVLGLIFQPSCDLGTLFTYGKDGFTFTKDTLDMMETTLSPDTCYTMTRLLETGGIMGMMSSVSIGLQHGQDDDGEDRDGRHHLHQRHPHIIPFCTAPHLFHGNTSLSTPLSFTSTLYRFSTVRTGRPRLPRLLRPLPRFQQIPRCCHRLPPRKP